MLVLGGGVVEEVIASDVLYKSGYVPGVAVLIVPWLTVTGKPVTFCHKSDDGLHGDDGDSLLVQYCKVTE
jgi:hypothetical protein